MQNQIEKFFLPIFTLLIGKENSENIKYILTDLLPIMTADIIINILYNWNEHERFPL